MIMGWLSSFTTSGSCSWGVSKLDLLQIMQMHGAQRRKIKLQRGKQFLIVSTASLTTLLFFARSPLKAQLCRCLMICWMCRKSVTSQREQQAWWSGNFAAKSSSSTNSRTLVVLCPVNRLLLSPASHSVSRAQIVTPSGRWGGGCEPERMRQCD